MPLPRILGCVALAVATATVFAPAGPVDAAGPDLVVRTYEGTEIPNGGVYAMGGTNVGIPFVQYLVLSSEGDAALTGVTVTMPAGFELVQAPASTIEPGASVGVYFRCLAAAPGYVEGDMQVVSNDASDNPYLITVSCSAAVDAGPPDIEVSVASVQLDSGVSVVNLGSTPAGTGVSKLVQVRQRASGALVLEPVQSSSPDISAATYVPDSVAPADGPPVSFVLRCLSATPGQKTATITLPNNSANAPNFTFTATCTVTGQGGPGGGQIPQTGSSGLMAILAGVLLLLGVAARRLSRPVRAEQSRL